MCVDLDFGKVGASVAKNPASACGNRCGKRGFTLSIMSEFSHLELMPTP